MTPNGKGLAVVVRCKNIFMHDWMSFAAWYSVHKNMPDAKVIIWLNDKKDLHLFHWTKKFNVNLVVGKNFSLKNVEFEKFIYMNCDFMMVRDVAQEQLKLFNNNELSENLYCDVEEERGLPFVYYGKGFKKFVISEWINNLHSPFRIADSFMTYVSTMNEIRVLKLWKQMGLVYDVLV